MKALAKYEEGRRALAEARTLPEIKSFRDKAEAMRAYAKQAGDRETAFWAAELKLRAERRAGEMLTQTAESGERAKQGGDRKSKSHDTILKLEDFEISLDQSSRWQKEATLPENNFENYLQTCEEKNFIWPTTTGVLKRVNELAHDQKIIKVPDGKYSTIVIDPPWDIEKIERSQYENQAGFDYRTMSEDELAAFAVPKLAHDDCHLFCWTTHKFLPMALRLLPAWKFRYVCAFVWHKPGGFQPIGLPQYNCEFALYARKGTPRFLETTDFFCCFEAPRREHSRKPDKFYKMIERVCPGPRIDVFSRELRDGFDQFGDETAKFEAAS